MTFACKINHKQSHTIISLAYFYHWPLGGTICLFNTSMQGVFSTHSCCVSVSCWATCWLLQRSVLKMPACPKATGSSSMMGRTEASRCTTSTSTFSVGAVWGGPLANAQLPAPTIQPCMFTSVVWLPVLLNLIEPKYICGNKRHITTPLVLSSVLWLTTTSSFSLPALKELFYSTHWIGPRSSINWKLLEHQYYRLESMPTK